MPNYTLTKRQLEVCKHLLYSSGEIASILIISPATVRTTVQNVMRRTNSGSRAEILVKLIRDKVLNISDIHMPNEELLEAC